ncbi:MAG: hypothetical protein QE267_02540 [Akkermansiaceae bacterium]|jgi:hypothetical protein|nr:hypothetical protein [Akkermansiaceae bacterium]
MDLRLPIGIIFTLYGLILIGYGLITKGSKIYEKSLGINVNISWGILLLVFGLVMYYFAKRAKKS